MSSSAEYPRRSFTCSLTNLMTLSWVTAMTEFALSTSRRYFSRRPSEIVPSVCVRSRPRERKGVRLRFRLRPWWARVSSPSRKPLSPGYQRIQRRGRRHSRVFRFGQPQQRSPCFRRKGRGRSDSFRRKRRDPSRRPPRMPGYPDEVKLRVHIGEEDVGGVDHGVELLFGFAKRPNVVHAFRDIEVYARPREDLAPVLRTGVPRLRTVR